MRSSEAGPFSCRDALLQAGYPHILLPVEPWQLVRWAYTYERENRTGDPFTQDAGHILQYNKVTSALLLSHTRRSVVPCGVQIGHEKVQSKCYDASASANNPSDWTGVSVSVAVPVPVLAQHPDRRAGLTPA